MTALALLGILAALAALAVFAKWRLRHLEAAAEMQTKFFQAMNALVDDQDTPPEVLNVLESLAKDLMNAQQFRRFVWFLLFHTATKRSKRAPRRDLEKIFNDMPDQLRGYLAQAFVAGVFAISFQSAFVGLAFRRVALIGASLAQRPRHQKVDTSVIKYVDGITHGGDGCVATA